VPTEKVEVEAEGAGGEVEMGEVEAGEVEVGAEDAGGKEEGEGEGEGGGEGGGEGESAIPPLAVGIAELMSSKAYELVSETVEKLVDVPGLTPQGLRAVLENLDMFSPRFIDEIIAVATSKILAKAEIEKMMARFSDLIENHYAAHNERMANYLTGLLEKVTKKKNEGGTVGAEGATVGGNGAEGDATDDSDWMEEDEDEGSGGVPVGAKEICGDRLVRVFAVFLAFHLVDKLTDGPLAAADMGDTLRAVDSHTMPDTEVGKAIAKIALRLASPSNKTRLETVVKKLKKVGSHSDVVDNQFPPDLCAVILTLFRGDFKSKVLLDHVPDSLIYEKTLGTARAVIRDI
jgi:hypothetical protein